MIAAGRSCGRSADHASSAPTAPIYPALFLISISSSLSFTLWAWTRGGFSGDGGPATQAEIDGRGGVAVHPGGSLYIVDSLNQRVRRVDANGTIETVAGNGTSCGTVDSAQATQTPLCNPSDIEIGADGTFQQ